MKITTDENAVLVFEEVFVPIVLRSQDKEDLIITMRDSGFEIGYDGRVIECKNQQIKIHDLYEDKTKEL